MIRRNPVRGAKEEDVIDGPKGFDDYDFRIGDVMRGERATRGKSLLDVQRELRIKATYIAAVENADPSAFDTPGFIAGYVRSYARYLELDPDETFAQFCKESGFSASHGMSDLASTASRNRAEAGPKQISKKDPFADKNSPFAGIQTSVWDQIDYRAVGSSLVLVALIGGLVFGGWTFLRQVQQVQLDPLEDAADALTGLDPLDTATTASDDGSVETAQATTDEKLGRLYRPQALEVPVLVSRDAPIASLDPGSVGAFGAPGGPWQSPQTAAESLFDPARLASITTGPAAGPAEADPAAPQPQVVEAKPEEVRIVAVREAWMRVTAPDGSVIFSALMAPGDHFDLPAFEGTPTLLSGASDGAYFEVGGTLYGPVGDGTVVRDVKLTVADIQDRYTPADPDLDADLSRYAAAQQLRTAED
ncbi:helix-turn-helix domain-containing protein [Chachezhania antarctica]|uniref:helix-turn-helix domain-containing protein n=1 Tax=Chachezhania antarctica TaxID=2340860 RepID=UPI000EB3C52A|nr:RodZ domain-containing protein [Chachezhania antarctica]